MEVMDQDQGPGSGSSVSQVLQEVRRILWGQNINQELFHRWSQGLIFSGDEPTALVQREGGPCAVIAPVQAFLFRAIMRDPQLNSQSQWRKLSPEVVDSYLCHALVEILHLVATSEDPPQPQPTPENEPSAKLKLLQQQTQQEPEPMITDDVDNGTGATLPSTKTPPPSSLTPTATATATPTSGSVPAPSASSPTYSIVFLNQPLSRRISTEAEKEAMTNGPTTIVNPTANATAATASGTGPGGKAACEEELFHRNLRLLTLDNINQVENVVREKLDTFKGHYGILQFLYSVILTKGVSKLSNEMSEASELIDPVHGHGGQSMINLFISGRGVNYVWDNDKDLGGLQLKGIGRQCEVGFLTLLERLRYCEVGTFLKSPKYPVWLMGSETHLTVLFSWDMNLVRPESPGEIARRVFATYDSEGSNFIQAVLLEDVMRTLGLFADSEYVELMKKKLDPEGLGIILQNDFMEEFFQNERYGGPDTFTLFHYNGLSRSSSTRKVVYSEGNAILLESDVRCVSEDNMVLTCLQTKWPNIDVQWIGGSTPSIN